MPDTPLGLPSGIRACLFDLDGVITSTERFHAQAWKETFDPVLAADARAHSRPFVPFDLTLDYERYVDGKPRDDGTRSFLASRGIQLPEGTADDAPTEATVRGLGKRKNARFLALTRAQGVVAYPGSLRYLRAVREAGLRTAIVSSSKNCEAVLDAAGITTLFDARVDGVVAAERRLAGKPSPAVFLEAAKALSVEPADAAVFEDALAGVEAARAGRFGFVVGVDRAGEADALRRQGADVVVTDLATLLHTS